MPRAAPLAPAALGSARGTGAHRGSGRTGRGAAAPARGWGPRTAASAGPSGRRGCGTGRRGPACRARPAPARPPPGTAGAEATLRGSRRAPGRPPAPPARPALTAFCRSASPFLRAPGGRKGVTCLCASIRTAGRDSPLCSGSSGRGRQASHWGWGGGTAGSCPQGGQEKGLTLGDTAPQSPGTASVQC